MLYFQKVKSSASIFCLKILNKKYFNKQSVSFAGQRGFC